MREVFEPEAEIFTSYLQIEAIRRRLFLDCCDFKMTFALIKESMKKIKPNKKLVIQSDQSNNLDPSYIDPEFLLDEDLHFYFYKLQSGNLSFPLCYSCFVPIYENDCGSMIAYSLCSFKYYEEILQNYDHNIETMLLKTQYSEWNIQASSYDEIDIKHTEFTRKLYGDQLHFTVTCYYPFQFHALREAHSFENEQFAISISRSIYKSEDLGKSGAMFKKTHDQLFIFKLIDEKEFRMFLAIAPNYFIHMCKSIFHNMPSILNVCFGAYKITTKNFSTGKGKTE